MAHKARDSVTDDKWFELLRHRPDLDEVNFWAPGAKNFRALQIAVTMFLFKLHASHVRHLIVGGGIFAFSNVLPCSLAWEAFGEANGARSEREMRARIAKLRRLSPGDPSDFSIGCRILTQPFFFEERDWIPACRQAGLPISCPWSIYSTSQDEPLRTLARCRDRLKRRHQL